ncbi:MAG: hypothetical protein HZB71_05580 [Betaproteobacteria bacterium]|nr:hypothetical protein [Betaproteobacteria bacterium]
MEVMQYEVLPAPQGYYIALFDEALRTFRRVSAESYRKFGEACQALFLGTWTPA